MPRNMSFAITAQQILDRTKTVTRRVGWANLRPGEEFWAVRKAMGLKPGEKVERLALLRCVSNRAEPLYLIGREGNEGCAREGFPHLTPEAFMLMFTMEMGGGPEQQVQRIEFEYVE